MQKSFKYVSFLILFLSMSVSLQLFGQSRIEILKTNLDSLSKQVSGLNEKVDFSVSGSTIQEVVRAIGINNKVNISIDPSLTVLLMNNFSDVTVKDVLIFLCDEYQLDIKISGTIISIRKYEIPVLTSVYKPKEIKISYNKSENLLSMDLNNDSLPLIAKFITNKSGKNIILSPEVRQTIASAYIENTPFDNGMEKFAYANNLTLTKTNDGFYVLSKVNSENENSGYSNNKRGTKPNDNTKTPNYSLEIKDGKIYLEAINTPISQILSDVSKQLNVNYYPLVPLEKTVTIFLQGVKFDELLFYILTGTEFSFTANQDVFLIGKTDQNEFKVVKSISMQHRSVVDIVKFIPASLKANNELIEFKEQNSLIVSGTKENVKKLNDFLMSIDKVVPMIVIEVLIIDNSSNYTIATGVKAGTTDQDIPSNSTVFPNIDMTLNSSSINKLINSFNGYGLINIGKVTPNFYVALKAMESNGYIKVRSTPKLATLNGSEASLTLGTTKYYFEETNSIITSQSTQNIKTKQYKSLQANFTLKIKPIVSGDDQVGLDITVEQTDFTGEVVDGAPPGQVTRSFSSIVRVKNEEMVLLGGLEESNHSDASTGTPFLSRVWGLKWLFSSRTKQKKTSKLNVFIKPTIIY